MQTHRLILTICFTILLTGCASFNDTLVVDVGEQFRLLDLEVEDNPAAAQANATNNGFECDFDARSRRESLLGGERLVSGTIRCRPLSD